MERRRRMHMAPQRGVYIAVAFVCAALLLAAASGEEPSKEYAHCDGRRMWIHDIPSTFNTDLLYNEERDTKLPSEWYTDTMLKHLSKARVNLGFGKPIGSIMGLPALEKAWYNTDHNTLENIFYYRMLSNPCRVGSYEQADLIYVPYFGAHDSLRNMHKDYNSRDRLPLQLMTILRGHAAWQRRNGSDHFWVLGSPIWDFYRNEWSAWGSELLFLDGAKDNIWTVVTERAWSQNKIQSSPQPTGFHPQSLGQVQEWQKFVGQQERKHLFAFAGGHRGHQSDEGILREKLFWQCANANGSCGLVDCSRGVNCLDINKFFGLYLSASFCLHPIGDSCTRRSLVDAALAGCIPVVFKECTLKSQFHWHLGKHVEHPERLYVYIPAAAVRGEGDGPSNSSEPFAPNSVLVEEVLRRIPASEVEAMRNNIIELIPRLTYGGRVDGDTIKAPDFKDAVDVIVDGLASTIAPKQGQ